MSKHRTKESRISKNIVREVYTSVSNESTKTRYMREEKCKSFMSSGAPLGERNILRSRVNNLQKLANGWGNSNFNAKIIIWQSIPTPQDILVIFLSAGVMNWNCQRHFKTLKLFDEWTCWDCTLISAQISAQDGFGKAGWWKGRHRGGDGLAFGFGRTWGGGWSW